MWQLLQREHGGRTKLQQFFTVRSVQLEKLLQSENCANWEKASTVECELVGQLKPLLQSEDGDKMTPFLQCKNGRQVDEAAPKE